MLKTILIIDDNYNEVKELIKVLNNLGYPTIYQSEKKSAIPEQKYKNIRIVFLDLNLNSGIDDAKKSGSTLANILEKSIDENNGFIKFVIWSQKTIIAREVVMYLAKNFPRFNYITETYKDIPKNSIIKVNPNPKRISTIREDGKEKLKQHLDNLVKPSLENFLWKWEEGILNKSSEIQSKFMDIDKKDRDQNLFTLSELIFGRGKIGSIENNKLYYLLQGTSKALNEAVSQTEMNIKEFDLNELDIINFDPKYITSFVYEKNMYKIHYGKKKIIYFPISNNESIVNFNLNECFEETFSSLSEMAHFSLSEHFKKISMLNSMLLFNDNVTLEYKPGTLYEINDSDCLSENIIKIISKVPMTKPFLIEVSPMCDFYQNKRQHYRTLEGVFIIKDITEYKDYKRKENIYVSPLLIINGEVGYFVLDLKSLKTHILTEVDLFSSVLLYLTDSFSSDIIVNVGRDFARVGINGVII